LLTEYNAAIALPADAPLMFAIMSVTDPDTWHMKYETDCAFASLVSRLVPTALFPKTYHVDDGVVDGIGVGVGMGVGIGVGVGQGVGTQVGAGEGVGDGVGDGVGEGVEEGEGAGR